MSAVIAAPALHAGDRIRVSTDFGVFDAIVRVLEISEHGGIADLECCEISGLHISLSFSNADLVTRVTEGGMAA